MLTPGARRTALLTALAAVCLPLAGAGAEPEAAPLRSPSELVTIGFRRSRIVVMNEVHSNLLRSRRTRAVGRGVLASAHAAGARYLAMEALTVPFAKTANATRELPETAHAYLAQDDMRALIAEALALGWTLVPYEADFSKRPDPGTGRYETADDANWRDQEGARNIDEFLAGAPSGARMLVWCGHSHQRKTPDSFGGKPWVRLGQRLVERGYAPFVIDQSVTVEHVPGRSPRREDAEARRAELERLGGTGGWLREEDPSPKWRADASADAWVLSLDNALE